MVLLVTTQICMEMKSERSMVKGEGLPALKGRDQR